MQILLLWVPSQRSIEGRGVSCISGCTGEYRTVCQDAVYISAFSVDEQHQFSISHFLALSLIILLVFVPQVSVCISSHNWNLLPFRYVLNLSCIVKSLLLHFTKSSFAYLDLSMNLWLFCAMNLQQKLRLNTFVLVWTGSLACVNLCARLQLTFVQLSAYMMLQCLDVLVLLQS